MSESIRLTNSEMLTAASIGVRRQVQNLAAGRTDAHGASPEDGWTPHVEGCAGEMAVAKAFGMFWSGSLGDLRADDVGQLQVRTGMRHDHKLILHHRDPDDRAFVFVTGRMPNYVLHGWIMARDGKREEFWADPARGRPAFFVPQSALRSLAELRSLLGAAGNAPREPMKPLDDAA